MIFFTDITTNASHFCLCNIKRVHDPRLSQKRTVFIDPSVYELKHAVEYSHIEELHEIARTGTQYVSIDYPCDMNPLHSDEFIEKSIRNNLQYKDNPFYICTVQSKLHSYDDFKRQFEYLHEQIYFPSKIIGIGNLCRIMRPTAFTDYVFALLRKYKEYQYHFYGLSLALIKRYCGAFPNCSVDSTKWTFPVSRTLKENYGHYCLKNTRDIFFLEYMSRIRQTIPDLQY